MKKLILGGLLTLATLAGFSQTTTKIGTSTNYVEVKHLLQIDGLPQSAAGHGVAIDASHHLVDYDFSTGGGGISQAYADAHYMPLVITLGAYNVAFGTTAGTAAQGNDSRILNGQTAFGYGNHATQGYYKASNFVAGTDYLTPTGSILGLTGIQSLAKGGTGINAGNLQQLLDGIFPTQGGQAGKVWTTDGTHGSWQAPAGGGGTGVTGLSIATSNGINGSTTAGSTPVITIGTPLSGLIKGNGTGFLAAIEGTDFLSPNSNLAWNKVLGAPAFLLANQTITFTPTGGDVSGSTSGNTSLLPTLTINNNAVSIAKIQQVAQNHIFYRSTAGTGNLEDHTLTELKAALALDQLPNLTAVQFPVSTAQAAINNTKANIDNQNFTGAFAAPRTGNTTLQTDTIPQATFGGGSAQINDTLWISTGSVYGSFFNDGTDTIVITKINFILQGSSPSVTATIKHGTTFNSGGIELVTGGTPINNTTTGTNVTSLNSTKIAPGEYVWCTTPTVGTKATYLGVTILGYKIRKA